MGNNNEYSVKAEYDKINLNWSFPALLIAVSSFVEIYNSYIQTEQQGNRFLFYITLGCFLLQVIFFVFYGLKKRFKRTPDLLKYTGALGLTHSLIFAILAAVNLSSKLSVQIIICSVLLIVVLILIITMEFLSRKNSNSQNNEKSVNKEKPAKNKQKKFVTVYCIALFILITVVMHTPGAFKLFFKLALPLCSLCYSLFYAFIIGYKKHNNQGTVL